MLHGTIIALIFYIFECLLKPITSVTENYSPIGCILGEYLRSILHI